ncbi:Paired amphipathic helix protein Sin3a [Homalodisca vitripennis]|nr:Paired amphipathic helix protein Sin3a [Homalodisca vitripennis]
MVDNCSYPLPCISIPLSNVHLRSSTSTMMSIVEYKERYSDSSDQYAGKKKEVAESQSKRFRSSVPNRAISPLHKTILNQLRIRMANKNIVAHINSASASAAVASAASAVAPPTPRPPVYLSHDVSSQAPSSQIHPDDLNHAISYVSKVKNRFQEQPDEYKRFLEILQTYQNEQQNLKEGAGSGSQSIDNKQMAEAEMYSKVAQLFEDHDDLLAEFVHFLPDATDLQKPLARHCEESSLLNQKRAKIEKMTFKNDMPETSMCTVSPAKTGLKRSPSMTLYQNSTSTCQRTTYHHPSKKHKRSTSFQDVSF